MIACLHIVVGVIRIEIRDSLQEYITYSRRENESWEGKQKDVSRLKHAFFNFAINKYHIQSSLAHCIMILSGLRTYLKISTDRKSVV